MEIRTWPLWMVFALTGLIGFRGVFLELAQRRIRPLRKKRITAWRQRRRLP